jgi:hypothetical protein
MYEGIALGGPAHGQHLVSDGPVVTYLRPGKAAPMPGHLGRPPSPVATPAVRYFWHHGLTMGTDVIIPGFWLQDGANLGAELRAVFLDLKGKKSGTR